TEIQPLTHTEPMNSALQRSGDSDQVIRRAEASLGQDQLVLPGQAQHVFAAVMQDDQLTRASKQLLAGHAPPRRSGIPRSEPVIFHRHRPVSFLQLHDHAPSHSGTYTIEPSLSR